MTTIAAPSVYRNLWNWFEAVAGLLAMFVISWGPPCIFGLIFLVSLFMPDLMGILLGGVILGVTGPMAVWLKQMSEAAAEQFFSAGSLRHVHKPVGDEFTEEEIFKIYQIRVPYALLMAGQLPSVRSPLRYLLCVWWLAHFLSATTIAFFCHQAIVRFVGANDFVVHLWGVFFAFIFHFAANIFLVLAVKVGSDSPEKTVAVWRHRFLIDTLAVMPFVAYIFR